MTTRPCYLTALLLVTLQGCGLSYPRMDVRALTERPKIGLRVTTGGRLISIGRGVFSLYPSDEDARGGDNDRCVALILKDRDKEMAEPWEEKHVLVTGRMLPLEEIKALFETGAGEIEGRGWSGSNCTTNAAIFVSSIRLAGG